jgi:hypothetical protein
MSQPRELFKRKRLVEVLGDVVHHAMDAPAVDLDRTLGGHGRSFVVG